MRAGEPGGTWRVVVVDDQALVVSAFEMLLAAQADLEVAGTASDGAAALALLRGLRRRGRGADVVLNYLPEEQSDAEDTASWVEKAGRRCVLVAADLSDEAAARAMVDEAVEGLGGLDVLVNNAAFQWARRDQGLASVKTEEMDLVMKVNLYALIWVTQQALPHLGEGSSIINVSSIQAYDPSERLIDYASTKAAINNITVNLANELGPKGIRVNSVAPGPIWTPLQPATKDGDTMPEFGVDTPLGRPGQPAELAGAFVYLASPLEASYVTGTVLG